MKYTITVEEKVNEIWPSGDAFHYTTEPSENGTSIHVEVKDQSALYGVLRILRNMGLELVSIEREEI